MKIKFSQDQQMQLVAAVRAGIAKAKHHKNYTKRVHDIIDAEISEAIPGCVVHFGSHDICVWHSAFCHYETRWFVLWSWPTRWDPSRVSEHWSDTILNDGLRREDISDYIERQAQERAIFPEFIELNNRAAKLMEQLEQVREIGRATILGLPIPKAATLRTSSSFWSKPTSQLMEQFPELFPA